ncbi:hypothetical protein HNQ50_001396 [Silvimonas terrae]|uniref:Uncharacterized protein n=1 Tax=Silvimonas terrae TaxID=300266 RepID=A0A840RDK9_9NEIS|nr:hypothetical protein [Silvimonas terrae]MBB5190674.1 hypothetical protein [Silvimonas terrae]
MADLFRSEVPLPAILMAIVREDQASDAELMFKRVFFDVPGLVILASAPLTRDQLGGFDWIYYDTADKKGIASVIYTEGAAD